MKKIHIFLVLLLLSNNVFSQVEFQIGDAQTYPQNVSPFDTIIIDINSNNNGDFTFLTRNTSSYTQTITLEFDYFCANLGSIQTGICGFNGCYSLPTSTGIWTNGPITLAPVSSYQHNYIEWKYGFDAIGLSGSWEKKARLRILDQNNVALDTAYIILRKGNSSCGKITATHSIKEASDISIFPNPANNYIIVDGINKLNNAPFDKESIIVTNINGAIINHALTISNRNHQSIQIDVSKMISGIYFIKIGAFYHKFIKL